MRKPDRFEKMVIRAAKAIEPESKLDWLAHAVMTGVAIKLLRRQHQAYVRIVTQVVSGNTADSLRANILASFTSYNKGTP